jgi:hypothetical protein
MKPFKPPVDFTLLYSCIENDIDFKLLDPNWDKHLPKVIKRKEEEDETDSNDFESEVEEIPDELNHDPCEGFEFDETGAGINKFPYEDLRKKFVKRGYVCVSVDCVCPSSPAPIPQESFSFSPPSSSSSTSIFPSSPPKASTASVSSPSFLSKFSYVFSCCVVGPPEEDIGLIQRLSKRLENPPMSLSMDINNEFIVNNPSDTPLKDTNRVEFNRKEDVTNEPPHTPSSKRIKSRKVKRNDNEQEIETFKKSVICNDDENSNEEKKVNFKGRK